MFVVCAEKMEFSGFGFFQQGGNCALRGEDGSQRGKCNSPDQRMAAGCILTDIREPKWESRVVSRFSVFVAGGIWRLAEAKEGSRRKKLRFGGSRLRGL